MVRALFWSGPVAALDDFGDPIKDTFIDGATRGGSWAIMTPASLSTHGRGLGTGSGQMYVKQDNGRWMKVAG